MTNKHRHFILQGKYIMAYSGHDDDDEFQGYTRIATVTIDRACQSLIRHANLGEDLVQLMDVFLYEEMQHYREGRR